MMRVALIDPSLFTLPYDRALLEGLSGAGHQAELFGRAPGIDDNDPGSVTLHEVFYKVTGSQVMRKLPGKVRLGLKGLDHLGSMIALRRALHLWRPDVIHFQWLTLPVIDKFFLPALRKLAPLVLTVHDTNPFNGDPSSVIQRRGFFSVLSTFDRMIVHTEQGRHRLLEGGVAAEKLVIMPHGPLTALSPVTPNPMTGEITFLLFGKIKPYKGLDLLISAFAALPQASRKWARIRVVGKPYMDLRSIKADAERLGISQSLTIEPRFIRDDEVKGLFGPGVVAVFPYREIEASGVLSIALAHGCPIIAASLGAFSEVVQAGINGLLFKTGDVAALTNAMNRMIEDRAFAAHCAAGAWKTAESCPDWVSIAHQTAEVYQSLRLNTNCLAPESCDITLAQE